MAMHSSILAWEIPWREEPGGLQSVELQKSQTQNGNSKVQYTRCHLLLPSDSDSLFSRAHEAPEAPGKRTVHRT